MRLVPTDVPTKSKIIRFVPGDGPEYEQAIVVTEEDEGATLYLQAWIGKPLTPSAWRLAQAELYPSARKVRFDRWCPRRRAFRSVTIPLSSGDSAHA